MFAGRVGREWTGRALLPLALASDACQSAEQYNDGNDTGCGTHSLAPPQKAAGLSGRLCIEPELVAQESVIP
jgi:hypothetical protein